MSLLGGYITLKPDDPHSGPDAAMSALVNSEADAIYMYESTVEDRKGCTNEEGRCSFTPGLPRVDRAWRQPD